MVRNVTQFDNIKSKIKELNSTIAEKKDKGSIIKFYYGNWNNFKRERPRCVSYVILEKEKGKLLK